MRFYIEEVPHGFFILKGSEVVLVLEFPCLMFSFNCGQINRSFSGHISSNGFVRVDEVFRVVVRSFILFELGLAYFAN